MNDLFIELAKQSPYMVIILVVMWMLLSREDKRDEKRVENAKQAEQERRQTAEKLELMRQRHEIEINSMWANAIKNMTESTQQSAKIIAESLENHEKASQARYERMNITQDLLKLAKERLEHEGK